MTYKSEKTALCLATAVAALFTCPGIAFAQIQVDDDAETEESDQIVVTGTLIRGVEVTGAQSLEIDQDAIIETGASTTNELLGTLPQVTNLFNARPDNDPRIADRQQVSRPNLRNLPGLQSATGATTLILVDGHRMTPMGVDQASFDPDFIPPGAIERVEVVTDGGSSLYGADAVGGVINFITRRNVEGVELVGGYDIGDDYQAFNVGVTAGQDWNGGSAYISYSLYDRDELLNSDRDFAARGNWNADGTVLSPSGTQCLVPVGEITTWANFGAGWTNNPAAASLGVKVRPVGTPCDIDSESSLLPELQRHSALFGLTHNISDTIRFDLRANYGSSSVRYSRYPQGDTVTEPNPNELRIPGVFRDTYDVASVGFSYGTHADYDHRQQKLDLEVYGITPELTVEVGSGWQIKTTGYWGESDNSRVLPSSDRAKLISYVRSGQFDPLNAAAASTAVLTDILDFEVAGEAVQSLLLGRVVADGPVFELFGDEVRAAVGVEYNRDRAALRSGSFGIGDIENVAFDVATRNVKSAFAEVSIPLFNILDISLSGRYDDYSDFGSTFNPTVGASLTPIEGIRIYGHWGESFNAPTALDSVRTANARFIANASAGVPDPLMERVSNPTRNDVLLVEGSGGDLEPQTAETWAIGAEFEPIENFTFGANYYNIDFRNLLSSVNPQLASVVLLNPEKFISFPTQEQFDAFLATTSNGEAQFGDINANDVGIIIDRRVANIAEGQLEGIDFFANLMVPTGFGELNLGVSGNKQLTFVITDNGNTVDQLQYDLPDLNLSAHAGLRSGGFRSRVTLNYTNGFDTNSAVAQTEVESFLVTDLFLGYEFPEGSGAAEGLALRLAVDNVFDVDPPVFRQQRNLNFAGFTLGRIFKFGVSKKF